VDLIGDDIAGASVHITHSITALAQPSEILVSRAVKDLVLGTGPEIMPCAGSGRELRCQRT
jgi:class 3 adenylate cyclase